MDEKRSPVMAGLGGAALATALVTMGGSVSTRSTEPQMHKAANVLPAGDHADITSNQEGPWYAFCQEYATTEFDHGEDPMQERGIKGHQVPAEAEVGTAEITRSIHDKNGEPEVEKFNVRKHTVGELTSCVPEGETLRVVIAMVPDPNATQMRLDFDRDIVAIQRAAAAEHYLYTRFWFPWRGNDWTPDRNDDPEAETRRRQEPGILCFRKQSSDETTDRLFVLLVGETPTSGANRIQLGHALSYDEQLTGHQKEDSDTSGPGLSESNQIDISGPHFSASFKPIRDVLMKVKHEHLANVPGEGSQTTRRVRGKKPQQTTNEMQFVNFVSPDASGKEFIAEFQSFCSAQKDLCQLRTLSLSSDDVRVETLKFLRDLGYKSDFVAQLSEDESAFGISQIDLDSQDVANGTATGGPKKLAEYEYGLKLHFPRDLSSVRSLSDEQSAKVAQAGSKYFSLPDGTLPTQLAAREPIDRDSPAAFGAEQEPAEVARSLADSVEEMRIHRIRAVVITASNPLDRIYLLEYLHNQLPDIRAVTIEADTLELDRPHFIDLTGTIAVTGMPPLAGMTNQIGDDVKKPAFVSFASSRQESEFLAIETLLDQDSGLDETAANRECFNFSVVGGTGFRLMPNGGTAKEKLKFPCHVMQSTSDSQLPRNGAPAEYFSVHEHTSAPRGFLTFAGVILVWNFMHWWGLFGARRRAEGMLSYAGKMVAHLEPRRVYLFFVLNNQLLILNLLVYELANASVVSIADTDHSEALLKTLFGSMAISTVIAAVLSTLLLVQFIRSRKQEGAEQGWKPMASQVICATVYLIWSIWMVFSLPITGAGQGIFLERMTNLSDGLSPVLPITALLLGYFLWAWIQLQRLEWSASRKAHLDFDEGTGRLLHSATESLQTCLEDLSPTDPRVLGTCLLLALCAALILRQSLNGLDGGGFFLWFEVWGTIMLLLTIAMTCVHAWSIWSRMRNLLTLLEGTSISSTFKRLADAGTLQVKIWDLAKTQKTFKFLRTTVDSIGRLNGPASADAVRAERQFSLLLRADSRHRQLWPGQIDRFNEALNVLMDSAVESLSSNTFSNPKRDELDEYLALRLVALIRYGMLHIGVLISFVAYGFVLAVGSIMFYPFEGRKTMGELLVITFVALLIWVGTMMVQFQRNEMLSRLDGSIPGEANYGQVVLHLLTVGGLPLIAILTSQFPGIANFAYTFFRPLLGVLH